MLVNHQVFHAGGWAAECRTHDFPGFDRLLQEDPTRLHNFLASCIVYLGPMLCLFCSQ